jgi:hypothetical protein
MPADQGTGKDRGRHIRRWLTFSSQQTRPVAPRRTGRRHRRDSLAEVHRSFQLNFDSVVRGVLPRPTGNVAGQNFVSPETAGPLGVERWAVCLGALELDADQKGLAGVSGTHTKSSTVVGFRTCEQPKFLAIACRKENQ